MRVKWFGHINMLSDNQMTWQEEKIVEEAKFDLPQRGYSVSCPCKIILSWKKLVFFLFITVSPNFDSSSFSCFSHCHFNSSVIIVYIYTLSSPNPRSYFHQISLLFSVNKFRVSGLEFSTLFVLFFYINKPM